MILSRRFEGPRLVRSSETSAVLKFITRIFSGGCPAGMVNEYPQLYRNMGDHLDWSHVVVHDRRVVAHVGVYPLELVTSGRRVMAGGIGAVAVEEKFRSEGLMSALLDHCTGWMHSNGLPLSILWGDHRRYARFGWVASGCRISYGLNRRSAGRMLDRYDLRVREVLDSVRVVEELHALHRRLPMRVERTPEAFAMVLQKDRRHVFVAMRGRRVAAYVLAQLRRTSRGRKEWLVEDAAGASSGILSILRFLVSRPDTEWIQGETPMTYCDWLAPLLRAADCHATSVRPLGQLKLVDEKAVLKSMGVPALGAVMDRLKLGTLERVRFLFGPLSPDLVLPSGPLRRRLAGKLPLPVYLSPADHV